VTKLSQVIHKLKPEQTPPSWLEELRTFAAWAFVFFSFAFAGWAISDMYTRFHENQQRREEALAPLRLEVGREFIITVARDAPRANLNLDMAESEASEVGRQAISAYATLAAGMGGPPPPPDPAWKLELSECKLKINKTLRLAGGEIGAGDINICKAAVYACIGAAILSCRTDQDMQCIYNALQRKCMYF
jgi:hypothetical protein